MSLSKQTRIFVHFPSTGEICEEIVNYKETISQLITRILNSLNINNPDAFHLYAMSQKCKYFKPSESCSSLFGICCEQLILTRSELINIDLFFENRHYYIVYEKSTPAMNFLENTLHVLQSTSTKTKPPLTKDDLINYYFALYDPIADVIIHSNSTINTNFIVLKRFEYIAPGYVFDFSIIKDISPKLSNCSYENTVISNFIKQFRSYHRNEHITGIEFVEFDEKRSQFLFDSFRNKQFDKNGVSISEQINFLFSILSLSQQPYVPTSLREMALEAMELEDDRKIFDIARAISIYLPLSTYLVLQEIFQFFGVATIDEASWNNVSLMLAELLFEPKSEGDEENYTDEIFDTNKEKHKNETNIEKEEREGEIFIKFTRFLFLYFKQIFHLKETIGRKNSIRMIKKNSKSTSKNKTKKSKKKKENNNNKEENQNNNDEYGNLFDWVDSDPNIQKSDQITTEKNNTEEKKNDDIYGNLFDWLDSDPKSPTKNKKKKENENSDEVQNDEDDIISETKKSKSGRKKKDKKNQDEENDNYSFILYEEMKSKEMITRTIDGFIDVNVDETIEFVPSDSIFDLLNSLAIKDEEEVKEQDISNDLNELNSLVTSLKAKFNSPVFNQPAPNPKS